MTLETRAGAARLIAAFALAASCVAPGMAAGAPEPARVFAFGDQPGDLVPDIAVADVEGRKSSLRRLGGKLGAVLITRDVECPVSQRYLPRIAELAGQYRARGYEFVVVDVTPHSRAEARKSARMIGGVRSILDEGHAIVSALKAESTAEAFVIDARGTLRYRGAIDDQYGIDYQRAAVQLPWLRSALDRVATGEEPLTKRTRAHGCPLSHDPVRSAIKQPISYHNRVSRIVQTNCQTCHHRGGLGPMPLENYRQVYERRAVIEAMVSAGRMPPWSARKDLGEWANDRSLSDRDKADLLLWIKSGGAEGNPADAPLPRKFIAGWNIGKPDATVPIPEPIKVPAQGVIAYKYVFSKTSFPEDKWVTAVEIRPTQPKVVHHVIAYIEEPGPRQLTPEQRSRLKPEERAYGFFAATVPGSLGVVYPEGAGKRLPKGAWIRFEIHYQPNGAELTDRTEIGFRFAPKPLREVESGAAPNKTFVIPPHAPRHEVKSTYKFDAPGQLVSLFPHMHLRGTAFRYELLYPDGRLVPLLDVPRFDFNWQSYYAFRTPYDVPAGAKLLTTAWYDNSSANPWNPDPSKSVRWGEQTYEEMMIGYFDFVRTDDAAEQARR